MNTISDGLKYSEWNDRGFKIHRGQKAVGFRDGEAVFYASQVYDPLEPSENFSEYLIRAEQWEEVPH